MRPSKTFKGPDGADDEDEDAEDEDAAGEDGEMADGEAEADGENAA